MEFLKLFFLIGHLVTREFTHSIPLRYCVFLGWYLPILSKISSGRNSTGWIQVQTDHMHLHLENEPQTCRLPFILHSHRGHLTGESLMQPKERWGPTGVLWKLQSLWQRILGGRRMSMEFENIKAGRGVLWTSASLGGHCK